MTLKLCPDAIHVVDEHSLIAGTISNINFSGLRVQGEIFDSHQIFRLLVVLHERPILRPPMPEVPKKFASAVEFYDAIAGVRARNPNVIVRINDKALQSTGPARRMIRTTPRLEDQPSGANSRISGPRTPLSARGGFVAAPDSSGRTSDRLIAQM